VDKVDKVDQIIQTISLPKALPEDVFESSGRVRRLPDIDLIIHLLPAQLLPFLDLEATILHSGRGGQNTFLLTLNDSSYLRIRIKSRSIVEMARTHLRNNSVRSIQ
jgi:hypothetical protein